MMLHSLDFKYISDGSLATGSLSASNTKSRPRCERLSDSKILPERGIERFPGFRSYLSIRQQSFPHWDMLLVTGYGARWVTESFRTGSICFFIKTLEFQDPRGWKAIGTRGSCSGSAVNFWAPGGSAGARPEASFVLPSIHIVEKILFCIIRISLNFYFLA